MFAARLHGRRRPGRARCAVGQFTPGPVFTTATFIGYVLAGIPGAVLATVGIFLPSFVFVAATNPLVPRLRTLPWTAALLDGVNVAALGLMAGVTWQLGRAAIFDVRTVLLALVAAFVLFRYQVNSAWLVAVGGLIGLALLALALCRQRKKLWGTLTCNCLRGDQYTKIRVMRSRQDWTTEFYVAADGSSPVETFLDSLASGLVLASFGLWSTEGTQ
ncbi:MAG TPA: chromate transporter [Ardenticatenaceae bacterium]|nr:chromate transporter [Ardenticatenaceae bacterium]